MFMIRFSPNPNRANLIGWFEWGEEAFREARDHDKPMMLFLTAFWCRYCQRMDEIAFSDDESIALLNAYFIAIRAEDAQRPDVNSRYNLNGWPTIVFMEPNGDLLAATNYLPTEELGNLLVRVYTGYQQKRDGLRSARTTSSETGREAKASVASGQLYDSSIPAITAQIMELADRVYGGYGRGQKFIHPEANDFLLARYKATKDSSFLDHVCLTLDRMREGPIHDHEGGGYFRTCSNEDWSHPHREKLLVEQAGMLANCLHAFRVTGRPEYARMAEDVIDYLDRKLANSANGSFYGCEDFLRDEGSKNSSEGEYFSIIDECVYADANAQTIVAYLEAASILERKDCRERGLNALEFLWQYCRSPDGGMFHYFDGAPHVPGLLSDQVRVGTALLQAYQETHDEKYLGRAKMLAEFILSRHHNPSGGYYDLPAPGFAYLEFRLTLIEQNGAAAAFFLKLAAASKETQYREAAVWALSAFTGDFAAYGIHAASFGQALGEFVNDH
jgi:uncharacterized protein YyaL (SSP411 family)